MRVWRSIMALAAAAWIAGTAATAAETASGAEAFLRHVYAPYLAGDTTTSPTGPGAPAIFDARLTALLRRDQASANGEVGALDQDPICACQDFDRLTHLVVRARRDGPGHATASVSFLNGSTATKLTYRLAAVGAQWRVSDISAADMPSLVALLQPASRR